MYFAPTKLGRALVESYMAIGQPLAKPYLRANMEAACSAICRGEKTKEEVVAGTMEEMREVFSKVLQSRRMLEAQVGSPLSPLSLRPLHPLSPSPSAPLHA